MFTRRFWLIAILMMCTTLTACGKAAQEEIDRLERRNSRLEEEVEELEEEVEELEVEVDGLEGQINELENIFYRSEGQIFTGYFSNEAECDRDLADYVDTVLGGDSVSNSGTQSANASALDDPVIRISYACVSNAGFYSIFGFGNSTIKLENEVLNMDDALQDLIYR